MTYIDFEKLKRERSIDPFSFSPIDIEATVAFTGEVMRDDTRANAEAMAEPGIAVCRVSVDSPTPRLRQRLAILGWLPWDPARDDRWYLDEPVDLRPGDNHLVSSFVAMYYAEGMNLLFAPDDGMFSGAAVHVAPGPDASADDLRARVRLLAERVWVAKAFVVPFVPVAWLVGGVERAVANENAARGRAGLSPLKVPSESTLGRWLREFRSRHWNRAGVGSQWRNYENPVSDDPDGDAGPPATSAPSASRRRAPRSASAATAAAPAAQTRAARARTVLDAIRAAAPGGRWETTQLGAGRTAREWVVDLGDGLQARLTTRFSGAAMQPSAPVQEKARLLGLPPLETDDAILDLYFDDFGKVLSVGTRGGVERVIGMTPGPWEARFGLPERPWSPSVGRRLAKRLRG